jgi:DNA-binding NarL/FixJ family response regulator
MDALAHPTGLKIATVEDSHFIIDRLQAILDEVGGVHFVGNAASMNDALILIEWQRPDVLFLDIRLGNKETKTGVNLLSVVNKKYPTITVVMLTNLSGESYRTLCAREGADFFLDKSRDFDKIPETLEQIMNQRY